MKAVIAIIGKDRVGIFAASTDEIAKANANIIEVSQSILDSYFAMVMVVDMDKMTSSLEDLRDAIKERIPDMQVHVMHENIFEAMHRI